MKHVVLIAHDIRSAHNIGSLMRTAEGLGINKMIISGYSPYPLIKNDARLPHLAKKISDRIHKTSLGAEANLDWEYKQDINPVISELKSQGYVVAALEQAAESKNLAAYKPGTKTALIVGNEISGVSKAILDQCDEILEIPMAGKKESFNVAAAAAMALYHIVNIR
jgi:tRNA G18 (ribose-2'-O)-methylase SpoU